MTLSNRRAPLTLLLRGKGPISQPADRRLTLRVFLCLLTVTALALLFAPAPRAFADGPADEEAPESPLWSADMLVVELTSVSIGAASADLFSNVGGSGGIKVNSLWSYTPGRDLRLSLGEGVLDPEGLTLQVGNLRLAFPAGSSTGGYFKWTDVDVDWEDGQALAVRIVPTSASSNTSATGLPSISGTAHVGETLMADATNIADADGLGNATFSYQWVSNEGNVGTEIEGATDATYTLVPADFGKTITVRVSFTDNFGGHESRASAPTGPVELAPPQPVTGAPTIIGMIGVGETLTASVSDIQDGNGLEGVEFSYQWLLSDEDGYAEIKGATDATYTLVTVDVSKTIKVRVSFTDQGGHPESLSSVPLAPSPSQEATGAPTIIGIIAVGATLTASVSDIQDGNGLEGVEFSYQWLLSDEDGYAEIEGATDATYTLVTVDVSKTIKVRVSFTDHVGYPESLTSVPLAPSPSQEATGAPTISGSPYVGQTLMASVSEIQDANGLEGVEFSYQWTVSDEGQEADIQGATDANYTLVADDAGKTVKVRVSFTDHVGYPESLTSAATKVIVIVDVPREPQNLAADRSAVSGALKLSWDAPDSDGDAAITGYRVQWKSGDEDYDTSRQAEANGLFHRLTGLSGGVEYTLRVVAVNAVGDGPPSAEAVATPLTDEQADALSFLDSKIEIGIVEKYEESRPWLRTTLEYMREPGFEFEAGVTDLPFRGVVSTNCYFDDEVGLLKCVANRMQLNIEFEHILIHEMAHVYTLTASLPTHPGPMGIAHVYFDMFEKDGCDASEVLADMLAYDITGYDGLNYWLGCNDDFRKGETDPITEQALSVVRSALSGQMPQWFADTYNDADGNPDLERLWADVRAVEGKDPFGIIFHLRDEFGGYCDNGAVASDVTKVISYLGRHYLRVSPDAKIRNPWRDGGCVPEAPSILSASGAGGELALSWSQPDSDGGAPIERYRVEWKSGSEDYDASRQAMVTDLSHSISGVTDGVAYTLRVTALNAFGDGASSTEVTATPGSHSPPTGAPVISGRAHLGETLNSDTSGIADEDGLNDVSFAYQWLRNEGTIVLEIPEANGSTYHVTTADVGKTIKVRVTFADDAGNPGALTSEETSRVTEPNKRASGLPTVSGTPEVRQKLWAATSEIADEDGLEDVTFSFQWFRSDATDNVEIAGATNDNYTLVAADEGKTITVRVSFADDDGNPETLTSAPTAAVVETPPNTSASGRPTVSGTPKVGYTLSVDTSGVSDEDGLNGSAFSYQWLRNDGAADTEISRATSSKYTLTPSDVGKTIKIRMTFTDRRRYEETSTSVPTAAVEPAPTIRGTTRVGMTLTAYTSGIVDEDGLEGATFRYQWIRSDGNDEAEISGATGSSYILVAPDEGKTIKVLVAFSDDAGNPETLTSAPTAEVKPTPNIPAVGRVTISGTPQSGQTLTGTASEIADENGLENASFKTVWVIGIGTLDFKGQSPGLSNQLHLGLDELGKNIVFVVSFVDAAGNPEMLTSAPTTMVATWDSSPATGLPTITGTPQVGRTLTANTSRIADEDGLRNATFSYRWYRWLTRINREEIKVATGSTYKLTAEDAGRPISVRVSFTDNRGNPEFLASARTATVQPPTNVVATGLPVIRGAPKVGQQLSADVSHIADENGLVNALFSYQWIRSDGTNDTAIEGEAGPTYTLVEADEGMTIKVTVSFTDDSGNTESLPSDSIGEVAAKPNSDATGAPVISGTAQVGQTLTADTSGIVDEDGLTNVVFSYQWLRNDGTADTEIAGATDASYTLVKADEGKTIKVTVSFTDAEGNPETLTSDATGEVEAKPNTEATGAPTIDGAARVGETLTADTSGIDDEDGLTNVAFSYQWIRNDASGDAVITGATDASYTLVKADEGKTIKVTVSFTDAEGNHETLTSNPTGAVAPDPGPLTAFTVVDASTDPDTPLVALVDEGTLILGNPTGGEYGIRVDTDSNHDDHDDIHKVVLALSGRKVVNKPEWEPPYSLYGDSGAGNLDGGNLPVGGYTLTATAHRANGDVLGTLKVSFTVEAQEQTAVPNTEATGAPTIGGFARVGETLTADTSGIDDDDGLTNVAFSYQWLRDDAEIAAATGATYTLVAADQGKTIKVTVSFTDDEGNPETLTSDPTGEVAPESGPLTAFTLVDTSTDPDKALGTLEDGRSLTLAAPAGDSYGIRVDTDSNDDIRKVELALSGAKTEGKTEWEPPYSLYGDSGEENLTGEDLPAGSYDLKATAYDANNDEMGTLKVSFSVAYANPAEEQQPAQNTLATGAPTIDGVARVGETLTADTSGIDDDDGLTNVAFSYQWLRGNAEIASATGETYTLVKADEGKTIKVTVSFTDEQGNAESSTSDPTGEVEAKPNTEPTGQPTISGNAQVGETLTADTSGIIDDDGLTNVAFSYQWTRSDGSGDTEIAGATDASYTLIEDDEGRTIKVTVSFTDAEGNPETLTSDPTGEVVAKPNTRATGAPTIDGIARVGETLTADTSGIDDEDELTNVVFAYQWLRDNAEIASATGETYTLVKADEGKTIKVTVSFTDAEANPETLTSDPTEEVDSEAGPLTGFTLVDTADPDQTVLWKHQTDGGTPEGDDTWKEWTDGGTVGLGNPDNGSYDVTVETESGEQIASVRLELTGEEKSADVTDDAAPYSLFEDEGEDALHGEGLPAGSYTLKATAYTEDDEILGTLEISFSVVAVTKPGRPQDLEGEATAQGIELTWEAPADSAVTHYVVYRGELGNGSMNGRPMTRYATIDATGAAMSYTDANVEAGKQYRYRVAAVNEAGEGKKSTWINIFAEDS